MEDVYLIVIHTPGFRDEPDGNVNPYVFVNDLDAALATLDAGIYTIMHGKREDAAHVPNQLRILKKIERKPKPPKNIVDPFDTEELA